MSTITEKILIAALELEDSGRKPFSAEELVVATWAKFPDAFGLAGYRDKYPDSNRIFAEIMGAKPIRKKGLLVKVGRKTYQLTESGKSYARRLAGQSSNRGVEKAAFSRDIGRELKRFLESKALLKYKEDRKAEITFYDLCSYLRISPRSSAIELQGRISNFDRVLSEGIRLAEKKRFSFEHGGQEFGLDDLGLLINLRDFLLAKFERELNTIRSRIDERNI